MSGDVDVLQTRTSEHATKPNGEFVIHLSRGAIGEFGIKRACPSTSCPILRIFGFTGLSVNLGFKTCSYYPFHSTIFTMAPGVVDASNGFSVASVTKSLNEIASTKQAPRFTPGYTKIEDVEDYEHEDLKPSFPDVAWPPLEEVPYSDKGLLGDPEYKDLLAAATDCFDYTPKIGTEIHGVQLKDLNDAQKNDLARLIAFRGVVFFRDQKDFTVDDQVALGRYFGTLHKHATTAMPKRAGLEEVHVVYTDAKSLDQRALFAPSYLWHSDVRNRFPRKKERCINTSFPGNL
jgi:hypothetical protein